MTDIVGRLTQRVVNQKSANHVDGLIVKRLDRVIGAKQVGYSMARLYQVL